MKKSDELINFEGQIALSFALGVLGAAYIQRLLPLIVFVILYEILYYAIYLRWPLVKRLAMIIAYIMGILIVFYGLECPIPKFV